MSSPTTEYSELIADLGMGTDSNQDEAVSQPNICNAQVAQFLQRIEAPAVRGVAAAVFSSLLNLLRDLPPLEKPGQLRPVDETLAELSLFHSEASSLVDFIRSAVTSEEDLGESFAETLDGVAFALSHDLRRCFDTELKDLDWKPGGQSARGKIASVHGLLTNCLEQSIISLAQVFDPSLDGGKLFDNYQARLRESLLLCRDLADLIHLVSACEKDVARQFPIVKERLDRFRKESMQFLMYKDWQEFESITEQLLASEPETPQSDSPVHSYRCYLETLLGHVKLRSVLADVSCDFFPDGESTDPEWGDAQNRLAFELYRAELTSLMN